MADAGPRFRRLLDWRTNRRTCLQIKSAKNKIAPGGTCEKSWSCFTDPDAYFRMRGCRWLQQRTRMVFVARNYCYLPGDSRHFPTVQAARMSFARDLCQ